MDWSGYERSGYGLEESGNELLEDEEEEDYDDDDDDEDEQGYNEDTSFEYSKPPSTSIYKRKYQLLMERMVAMNQDSEIMVYRISKIKKMLVEGRQEREFLMKELDKRGDKYRTIPVPEPFTENDSKRKESGMGEKKPKKIKVGKDKSSRDPNLPKRPQNPFFQYCKEQRDYVSREIQDRDGIQLSKKELTKLLAQRWNLLDLQDKQIYNERFEEERAGYNIKMEDFRRKMQEGFVSFEEFGKSENTSSMDFNDV